MMQTTEIKSRLRSRYTGDAWAYFEEVPNGTGTAKSRSCDAMAMGLWPSKGLHLHGHEIKASRSDWLKEIQDPSKSEAFAQYCDYWWIVAKADVVKLEELPADWGWMTPTKSGVRVKKAATKRQPIAIDAAMLAGFLRVASRNDLEQNALRGEYQRGHDEGWRKGCDHGEASSKRQERYQIDRLKRRNAELDETAGQLLRIKNDERALLRRMRDAKRTLDDLTVAIEKILPEIEGFESFLNGDETQSLNATQVRGAGSAA